ncbi:MAG TPA: hypothetical protein VH518_07895 [Tepidisphaeraceae bacterium]|jgi:hypothetical protein
MRCQKLGWVRGGLIALACAAGFESQVQAAVVIDNFSGAVSTSVAPASPNPSSSNLGLATANAIGGARNLTATRITGVNGMNINADVGSSGVFNYSTGPADTGSASILYDGGTDNIPSFIGLVGTDLTQGGLNTLVNLLYRADLAGATISVDIYTDATRASRASFNTAATGFGANPFASVNLPYASFSPLVGTGATFSNVGMIQITVDGSTTPALDLQIDSIQSIPEPAGIAVAGLCAGILMRRRTVRHAD